MTNPMPSQTTNNDLQSCDREVIHLTPSVQSHGSLLAFSLKERRVEVFSENTPEMLGLSLQEVTGARLEHLFGSEVAEHIQELIQSQALQGSGRHLSLRPRIGGQSFDAFVYLSGGLVVVELEVYIARPGAADSEINTEQILRGYTRAAKECRDLISLSRLVCQTIRRITGLDRVMMYRFIPPDYYGEVIAEDRVTQAHSYLHHRFPATDIPLPARALYLRNTVRMIPDVSAPTTKLVPPHNPLNREPLDMSDSRLRTVSPIHLEYLKNMRVGASFSVAVTDKDSLWGLITCHHLSPMMIPQSQRTACEIIAHAYSVQAPLLESTRELQERVDFEFKLRRTMESLRLSPEPITDLFQQHRTVTECFGAGGIAYVTANLRDFAGIVPLRNEIEEISRFVREKMRSEGRTSLAIDRIADLNPNWEKMRDYASGLLVAMVPDVHESLLMFFRPEFKKVITWGGDPRKTLERREFQGRINPRVSFEAWEEKVTCHSLPWRKFEIDGAIFLRDFVFDGLERKEALIRDLHRVRKND